MKKIILNLIVVTLIISCATKEQKLMKSIQDGNLIEVENLLKKGVDPNVVLENGLTPLTQAIEKSKSKIVKSLIDFDANVNLQDTYGYTPLAKAISRNNLKIVTMLLENKCKTTIVDTIAHKIFSEKKDDDIINILNKHKVNFKISNNDGATLSIQAVKKGNFNLLKFLIDSNPKRLYKKDSLGKTVFDYAKAESEILKYLNEAKRKDKIWPKIGSIVYFKISYRIDGWGYGAEPVRAKVIKIYKHNYLVKALQEVKHPSNNNTYWLTRRHIARTKRLLKNVTRNYND